MKTATKIIVWPQKSGPPKTAVALSERKSSSSTEFSAFHVNTLNAKVWERANEQASACLQSSFMLFPALLIGALCSYGFCHVLRSQSGVIFIISYDLIIDYCFESVRLSDYGCVCVCVWVSRFARVFVLYWIKSSALLSSCNLAEVNCKLRASQRAADYL